MSSRLGVRLFTGTALSRYLKRLPLEAYEECRMLYEGDIGNDGAALLMELRKRFKLEPVYLTTVMDLTVEARALVRMRDGDVERAGYLASARVPYDGSRLFLRTSIAPDFKARFRGRITSRSLHLITVLPSTDLSSFRDDALAEVDRINEALRAFKPQALAYAARVVTEIERVIQTI